MAVRDLAGSSEKILVTEPSGAVPSDLAGAVLTWAENDTLLVNGGRAGRGTLLVLDRGDDEQGTLRPGRRAIGQAG